MAAATRQSFQWDDPFLFAEQRSEDERLIAETARAYSQEKLLPRIVEAYMEEKTDRAIFAEMGALGLLGVPIPDAFGGAGSVMARSAAAKQTRALGAPRLVGWRLAGALCRMAAGSLGSSFSSFLRRKHRTQSS
jgi:alkylation response protein AidB-like acyl-CoA dehydrogenase